MTLSAFEKKIDKIKSLYLSSVTEYEENTNELFDDYISDMWRVFEQFSKAHSHIDLAGLINQSLSYAVGEHMSVLDAFNIIIRRSVTPGSDKSMLQRYFDEINDVYNRHNNDYNIVYCEENRDKLIEMNLKTVISIAKGYQGLGLSLEELISAGNLGLVTSFDKYDPARAKLKDDMMTQLDNLNNEASNYDIIECIKQYLVYGDVKKKFIKNFGISDSGDGDDSNNDDITKVKWKKFNKADVAKWIKYNVKNATFNSVAFMWIRAYILIEIDNNSRLVKKPKSEIYNDKIKYGTYKKEITVDIDAPISNDSDTSIGDILLVDDDNRNDIDVSEAYDEFKCGLNLLLDGVKPRDRSVFLKKFGIGLPRPMLPKEIAEQENLSIARISQIFQSVIEQMQRNQAKYNINSAKLFNAVRKIQ